MGSGTVCAALCGECWGLLGSLWQYWGVLGSIEGYRRVLVGIGECHVEANRAAQQSTLHLLEPSWEEAPQDRIVLRGRRQEPFCKPCKGIGIGSLLWLDLLGQAFLKGSFGTYT